MGKLIDKKAKRVFFIIMCSVLLIVHAFMQFGISISEMELSNTQKNLEEMAESSIREVRKEYEDMIRSLQEMTDAFEQPPSVDDEHIYKQLAFLKSVTTFDYVGVADIYGNTVDSAGQKTNIANREYFQKAMRGKTVISGVLDSQVVKQEEIQVLAVPIQNNGRTDGILFGIMSIDTLGRTINEAYLDHIYVQIVDAEGNYITRFQSEDVLSRYKNVWDDLEKYQYRSSSYKKIKEDIENGKEGHFAFRYGEEERDSYYAPLGINHYYIYVTTNSKYLQEHINGTNRKVITMAAELVVALLILLVGVYWYNRKVHQEILESHEEAISNEEMMRIAISQSEQAVFEYHLGKKELRIKAGNTNVLFPHNILTDVPESILDRGVMDEVFSKRFKQMFEEIQENEICESEVKVVSEGKAKWFRLVMKNLFDEKHQIVNTVGIVEDISERKQEELRLKERAERDGLTGFYNAVTMKIKVDRLLKSPWTVEGNHIFMLMDLDCFKQINDTFGHQYGDQVLKEVSDTLKKTFRQSDLLCRMGGDEFAIMILNVSSFSAVEHVIQKLLERLHKIYEQDGKTVEVSASLGIVCAPQYGTTFEELYKKSDQMLYEVKRSTKNGYRVYQEKEIFTYE